MISFTDVRFGYSRKKAVLENISMKLEPGNTYGLMGLNGAGKSTLLKLLAGLRFPDSGSVRVNGFIPGQRPAALFQSLFFVPEEFSLPDCTVGQFGARYGWIYRGFNLEHYRSLLKTFAVEDDARLHSLSFGQQKKAFLCFAFASGCPTLLLDEPTNGLDIPAKEALRRTLIEHQSEDGIIVLSTHQVREIERQISAIVIVHGNRIVLNEDLGALTGKWRMATVGADAIPEKAVFRERVAEGFKVLTQKDEEGETDLDLEFLFRAAVSNPAAFVSNFEQGATHA